MEVGYLTRYLIIIRTETTRYLFARVTPLPSHGYMKDNRSRVIRLRPVLIFMKKVPQVTNPSIKIIPTTKITHPTPPTRTPVAVTAVRKGKLNDDPKNALVDEPEGPTGNE